MSVLNFYESNEFYTSDCFDHLRNSLFEDFEKSIKGKNE
jgi:hypothetical protein